MPLIENQKILIVDDVIDNLKLMVSIFERNHPNYEIFQTSNSSKALEIALNTLPDLIITDWEMPELTGIELIEKLKSNPITSNIPIIIATGVMHSSADLQEALEMGAVDFIKKPLDSIEFIARTDSAIKTSKDHKKIVEAKNSELTENTLNLLKNREFINEISKKIDFLIANFKDSQTCDKSILNEISSLLKSKSTDDSLQRFNVAFYSVHEHFNRNLIAKFPNLTNNDLKLCAFLQLGMSTKDIASIRYQTPDSVKVSRSRLRKKLGLDQSQNLQVFLSAF